MLIEDATLKIEQIYTRSRQSKRRYRAFLNFLPIPLLVQNMDHSVAYLNPAYEKTFGWTREDLELNPFAPIPDDQIKKTLTGKASLLTNGVFYGLETKRLTKDGRELDVIYDGSALYDHNGEPNGLITTMRDITRSKKDARITKALFNIARALHHYRDLKSCLIYIVREVQRLMTVESAYILLDKKNEKTIYSRTGVWKTSVFSDTFCITAPALNEDPAGAILLSGRSYINNHVGEESAFTNWRLNIASAKSWNMMAVPLRMENQIIGAIVMFDRINGNFDHDDLALLDSIAGMVAMPIENARMNASLRESYADIQTLNNAKDRIIDRLSHELRTPISVLAASFEMLASGYGADNQTNKKLIDRCQRNIARVVDMQAKLEDIISAPDQRGLSCLTDFLELCTDELVALAGLEGGAAIARRIRKRIDDLFSRRPLKMDRIVLHRFVASKMTDLEPRFAHRQIEVQTDLEQDVGSIDLPGEILDKIVTGLMRNAIEYTPDGGRVGIRVQAGNAGPELVVSDFGIGITEENKKLIDGQYFTTADTEQYATGKPFDFNAGGRGLDLLRIRVFAERYPLALSMVSERCQYIHESKMNCPGSTEKCVHCDSIEDCHQSGGTTFTMTFTRSARHDDRT